MQLPPRTCFSVIILTVLLSTSTVLAQRKGGGGKNDGGGNDPPPSYNLPPFNYEVEIISVPGMGKYYDTNDRGVSAVSMRPNNDPTAPIDDPDTPEFEGLRTQNRSSAAAIVHPVTENDGSIGSDVVYLDNEIDPAAPYDLLAAMDINNEGQIAAWSVPLDASGDPMLDANGSEIRRAVLLIPNPDADAEGFAYDLLELPMPAWATSSRFELNSFSQPLTEVPGGRSTGAAWYQAYNEQGRFAKVFYYSDQSWTAYEDTDPDFPGSFGDMNGAGDFVPWTEPFVLQADGSTQPLTLVNGATNARFNDISENGYIAGMQSFVVDTYKSKGTTYPIYQMVPTFHDLTGQSYTCSFRDDLGRSDFTPFQWVSLTDQLVPNPNQNMRMEPVVAIGDGSYGLNMVLCYPGFDAATFRELMAWNPDEQAEFDAIFAETTSTGNLGYSEAKFRMPTPRDADGNIDHLAAPSLYEGALKGEYPDGTNGYQGIYVIRPVETP